MNNLLFTVLLIVLIYYFFYYLPNQKKLTNPNPILTSTQSSQTNPHPIDNQKIKELQVDIAKKEQTIIDLNNSYDKLETKTKQEIKLLRNQKEDSAKQINDLKKQITHLQTQLRDLSRRPLKPTNSKGVQTDELTSTLDTLIKEVQDLNNSL